MMSKHNSSDLAPQRQEMSVENVSSGLVPQGQKASDYDNSDPVPPRQNVVPSAEKTYSLQQGLEFLFARSDTNCRNPFNTSYSEPHGSNQELEKRKEIKVIILLAERWEHSSCMDIKTLRTRFSSHSTTIFL
ncbi:hypothetical protein Tco_1451833 [Tanacetum coccineum]